MANPDPIPFLDLRRWTVEDDYLIRTALDRVLQRGWFLQGIEVESFEREFAAYCGAEHCVAVDSGTVALTLLLRAAGIGDGDEVIVSGFTCMPTWLAIHAAGAIPVPVDVNLVTRNVEPSLVEEAITERTRAIVAVHLYGLPCDMRTLDEIAKRGSLWLFADAAQSCGAHINGSRSTVIGDGAAFSFYPTKNLACLGDGGAVVTADPELAGQVVLLRNYGMPTRDRCQLRGVNARMDELQAAVLRQRLPLLETRNQRRRRIASRYIQALSCGAHPDWLRPPDHPGHVWHVFSVLLPADMRDRAAVALREKGIQTALHYPMAPHQTEAFRTSARRALPVCERIAAENVSLPLCPSMGDDEVDRVIEGFNTVIQDA